MLVCVMTVILKPRCEMLFIGLLAVKTIFLPSHESIAMNETRILSVI